MASSCRSSSGAPGLPPCVNCPACARSQQSAASYRPTPWWHSELEVVVFVAKFLGVAVFLAAAFGGCTTLS